MLTSNRFQQSEIRLTLCAHILVCIAIVLSLGSCSMESAANYRVSESGELIIAPEPFPLYYVGDTLTSAAIPIGRVKTHVTGTPSLPCDPTKLKEILCQKGKAIGADLVAGIYVSQIGPGGERITRGCWATGMGMKFGSSGTLGDVALSPDAIAIVSGSLPSYQEWSSWLIDWQNAHPEHMGKSLTMQRIGGRTENLDTSATAAASVAEYDSLAMVLPSGDVFLRRQAWLQLNGKGYYAMPVDSGSPSLSMEQVRTEGHSLPPSIEYQWAENILICNLLTGANHENIGLIVKLRLYSRTEHKVIWESFGWSRRKIVIYKEPLPIPIPLAYKEEWYDVLGDAVKSALKTFPKPNEPKRTESGDPKAN